MGAQDVLSRKAGVIVGDDVLALFKYAREHEFAIPAINVTSSSTVVAALEGARDAKSPIILYDSYPSVPPRKPTRPRRLTAPVKANISGWCRLLRR